MENLDPNHKDAERDDLLPLLRRKVFDHDLEAFVGSASDAEPASLLMLDLDNFKGVNDTHGHPIGDEVLIDCANTIARLCRYKGKAYRIGGEEIAVLLPNFRASEAVALAESIRSAVEASRMSSKQLSITASIGVATAPNHATEAKQLLKVADQALYAAKGLGRNRVRLALQAPETRAGRMGNPVFRRVIYFSAVIVILAISSVGVYHRYRAYVSIPPPPLAEGRTAPPPDFAFRKMKAAVLKRNTPQLTGDAIARGAEPEGAPNLQGDGAWLKEEERLNVMPLPQIRILIADTIERLQVFENKWTYPVPIENDPPPIRSDGTQDPEEMKKYWERQKKRQKVEQEIRPTKRYNDFQKQFPNLETDVQYLNTKWPDIKPPDACFPVNKMQQLAANECAAYLKQVLEKYPRPTQ